MKKSIAILFLSFAAVSCAQERKTENKPGEKKRLASVTWDLQSHKLVWVVQKGTVANGEFNPASSDRYEISPDDAVMAYRNEQRGFTEEEAVSLRKLLDVLSLYCAESVMWWDEGQGVKHDPKSGPPEKGEKVRQDKPRIDSGELVARIARTLQ